MGMGAGCRTLGNAPFRAGAPIRQHAPIALSEPTMSMACRFASRRGVLGRAWDVDAVRTGTGLTFRVEAGCVESRT
eukprot:3375699-Pyramimonas_sp.AAC.1